MANDNRRPVMEGDNRNNPSPSTKSLRDMDAGEIRNRQRSGDPAGADERPDGPEPNETMRQVWSQPGGEAYNYRNAMVAAGTKADNHGDLTAAETPETTRHLSDASLSDADKQPEAGGAAPGQGEKT